VSRDSCAVFHHSILPCESCVAGDASCRVLNQWWCVVRVCGKLLGYGAEAVWAALKAQPQGEALKAQPQGEAASQPPATGVGVESASEETGTRLGGEGDAQASSGGARGGGGIMVAQQHNPKWGQTGLKIFANDFRFAERVVELVEGKAGAWVVVGLEGDAARQVSAVLWMLFCGESCAAASGSCLVLKTELRILLCVALLRRGAQDSFSSCCVVVLLVDCVSCVAAGGLCLVLNNSHAVRQPYYREGNGLNVGLYGPLDLVRLLPHVLNARRCSAAAGGEDLRAPGEALGEVVGLERLKEEMRRRRVLGNAMTQLVTWDSLRLSVAEVLFQLPSQVHQRIVSCRTPNPESLNPNL
jgi:hypothetical protein